MLPIEFLLITVWPVIDMRLRCKSKGVEYPLGVPHNVSKVLELDIVSVKPNLHRGTFTIHLCLCNGIMWS